jgi:hypothetical protein
MAVEVRQLKTNDAQDECILVCTTTGALIGFVFMAEADVVEQFLQWLDPRDPRLVDNDETSLEQWWSAFLEVYACHECGEKGEPNCSGLEFSKCCRNFFCGTHSDDETWDDPTHPDGPKTFGHECRG